MRQIFVQDPQTKLFFRDEQEWTPDSSEARNFKTSLNALVFCLQHDMSAAQIIVRFNQPGMADIVVPVAAEQTAMARLR